MALAKDVLSIVPGLQATALVAENVKEIDFRKGKRLKKTKPGKIIKLGVKNLVGVSLIKPTAEMINALP